MNVVSIARGYTGVESGGDDKVTTAQRVYTVVVDDPADEGVGWDLPLTAGGVTLPAPGTPHEGDANLVSEVPRIAKKGPGYFAVTVPYKSTDPRGERSEYSRYRDPLAAPAEVAFGHAARTVPYDMDMDGAAVTNVLGEPFDPPRTREVVDQTVSLEVTEAEFSIGRQAEFLDSVNSEAFWGQPAGVARMVGYDARQLTSEEGFFRVHYEIHLRTDRPSGVTAEHAWFDCVLNQGSAYFDDQGVWHPAPTGQLVLLDAGGQKTTRTSPHWLYFRKFKAKSWTELLLASREP